MNQRTREVNAVIIHPDGNAEIRYIEASAAAIGKVVGGWLEAIGPMVDDYGNWHAYVDEEGLYSKPPNPAASLFASQIGWNPAEAQGGLLRGSVVFLGVCEEGEGEDFRHEEDDVPDAVLQAALAFYREHGEVNLGDD